LLRVAFRQISKDRVLPTGWFVLIARGGILRQRSTAVIRELSDVLDRAPQRAAAVSGNDRAGEAPS